MASIPASSGGNRRGHGRRQAFTFSQLLRDPLKSASEHTVPRFRHLDDHLFWSNSFIGAHLHQVEE